MKFTKTLASVAAAALAVSSLAVSAFAAEPKLEAVTLDANGEKKISVKSRPHKNIALMKIKGIENIDEAIPLVGSVLYMDRKDCPLPDDVYFVQDIIGCEVRNINDGTVYGKVSDVLSTGANDVYEVKGEDNKPFYMPKIDEIVKEVNVNEEYILIEPMKGLFDED